MLYKEIKHDQLLKILGETRQKRKYLEDIEREIRREINSRHDIQDIPDRYVKPAKPMLSSHQIKQILKLTDQKTTKKIIDLLEN